MSPILDLQYKLRELGRIRMGKKGTRGAPQKLETWRLTSASDDLLKGAAEVYGGTVEPWDDAPGGPQFQLLTESDSLDIIIPPGEASLTQWMEMWAGGGCKRRCDGKRQMLRDVECSCPSDPEERRNQATLGKACKETTRFNVMLPKIPDLGVWRLETHGYYAARELAGIVQLLAAGNVGMVAARLRLDQRMIKRPDERTKKFIVPVVGLPDRLDNLLSALGMDAGAVTLPASAEVERRSLPGAPPKLSGETHDPQPDEAEPEDEPANTLGRVLALVEVHGITGVRGHANEMRNSPEWNNPGEFKFAEQIASAPEDFITELENRFKDWSEQGSSTSEQPSATTPAQSAGSADGAANVGVRVPAESTEAKPQPEAELSSGSPQHPCPECGTECVPTPESKTHWACPNGDFESYSTDPWKEDGEVERTLRRKAHTDKERELYEYMDSLSAKDARDRVAGVSDRAALELMRKVENDRPKSRTTVLTRIKERLESEHATGGEEW